MLKNQVNRAVIPFILIIFLSGCASASKSPTTNNPPASSPTEALQPTASPGITVSPSIAPTITATLDWEKMIVNNNGLIKEIESMSNCELPCWWGITPGETRWQDVETQASGKAIVSLRTLSNGNQQGELIIPVSMKSPPNFFSVRMRIESDIVQQIEIGSYRDASSGSLRAFLAENGKPDDIWIHSYYHNLGGQPPFIVWLFYWEKGMAAYFYNAEEKSTYESGWIKACIEEGLVLYLWNDNFSSLSELKKGRISFLEQLDDPNYPILPVEDAIGMDANQFYEEYGDAKDLLLPACFASDRSLWPEP